MKNEIKIYKDEVIGRHVEEILRYLERIQVRNRKETKKDNYEEYDETRDSRRREEKRKYHWCLHSYESMVYIKL